nr:MAG TPA: hypothetical protein [Caudoviricetes sp.]
MYKIAVYLLSNCQKQPEDPDFRAFSVSIEEAATAGKF